jgi:diacylglycerol kinase (ATP)
MRTVLILNPTSGSSTLAPDPSGENTPQEHEAAILAALRRYEIEPIVRYTTPEDAGDGLAKQATDEGADIVMAAGGDGTIHAVAAGLLGSQSALGIIALGTMNNVARSLGISETIEGACQIIAEGATGCIDVGKINGHVFLEVAGIGLESMLFPAAEEIKSYGLLSTLHGIADGLGALLAFQPTRFKISFDGHRSRPYRALQISICNAPYYGAHFRFAPQAVMDDGLLDVLIYKNFSKLAYLRHAIAITQGQRILEPALVRRRVSSLRIAAEQPVELHADGVPCGHTPADVQIIPGALRVRVPERVAAGPDMTGTAGRRIRRTSDGRNSEIPAKKGALHVKERS